MTTNEAANNGFEVTFLPPYSPMLNPIEEVIKDVKTDIKTQLATTLYNQLLRTHEMEQGTKASSRDALLKQALEHALRVVAPQCVSAHYNHMMSCIPCINQRRDL